MDAGYKILLSGVTEAHAPDIHPPIVLRPPFVPVPEDTQPPEQSLPPSGAEAKKGHTTGSDHISKKLKGEAAKPKHLLEHSLVSLLVVFLLVPGFLLFVGHVREGNRHNERANWSDQDFSSPSRDGELSQVIMDVAGADPVQAAIVAVNNPVEVAKCEGWRDWFDYESGWKGCRP